MGTDFGGRLAAGLITLAAALPVLPWAADTSAAPAGPATEVVIGAASPSAASGAVAAAGGHLIRAMPALGMVAAAVPESRMAWLAAQPGIQEVTPDRSMSVASTSDGTSSGLTVSSTPSVYRQEVGANDLAASSGDTGSGAVVALLDTGVDQVGDLSGRLVTGLENPSSPSGPAVDCINFSTDSTCTDGYGHGTFMAGLIAGTGAASNGVFAGVAPGAKIIDIKVAAADGSTDLVRVLAGIDWAISFRQQYGISVLNLSLGTPAITDPAHDPVDVAAEKAWQAGLAVVTAAGNAGPAAGTVTSPGDDPSVITVGAVDDRGTAAVADDAAAPFTSEGPTAYGAAKPDVAAPGVAIIGLQAPNSVVSQIPTESDLTAPNYGGAYRRGSGSSMATAITSGVAALLWSQWSAQPGFSAATWPDRLKAALTSAASPLPGAPPAAVGAGVVDAATAVNSTATTPAGDTQSSDDQSGDSQDGSGSASSFTPQTWYSGPFAGQNWEGQNWEGQSWEGQSWEGQSWEGQSWEGQSWEGQSWEGQSWEGQSWEGQSWEGQSWEGQSWEGRAWEGLFS